MIRGSRLKVPKSADKGEVVRVRTKIPHPMETGWRKAPDGTTVPRNRINRFACTFEGDKVFGADLHSGISANPYISFFVRVEKSGTFACTWHADDGETYTESARIAVEPETS